MKLFVLVVDFRSQYVISTDNAHLYNSNYHKHRSAAAVFTAIENINDAKCWDIFFIRKSCVRCKTLF